MLLNALAALKRNKIATALGVILIIVLTKPYFNDNSNNVLLEGSSQSIRIVRAGAGSLLQPGPPSPPASSKFPYIEFKSHCECRDEKIRLVKYDKFNYTVVSIKDGKETKMYSMPVDEYEKSRLTCDIFNSLRRGKNMKVHAYSLFGPRKGFYYDRFIGNSKNLTKLYPGWIIRVLHDDSIDKSIICEIECAKDDNGKFLDNTDFCDVTRMPESTVNESSVWSAFYMHPMKYRWLPAGDSFVDVTTSRDSDGYLVEREVHAVKEWFDSGKYGHIMRDHPWHTVYILGGAWGLYNSRNRQKSETIYGLVKNPDVAKNYHNKGQPMRKGNDQDFLGQHVYPVMKDNCIVHDGYLCQSFGGQPWPSKRQGNCYICNAGPCDPIKGVFEHKCPLACRPKDHQGTFSLF
jgi:hypothetical protein